jgi:hypothetical protein
MGARVAPFPHMFLIATLRRWASSVGLGSKDYLPTEGCRQGDLAPYMKWHKQRRRCTDLRILLITLQLLYTLELPET